MYTTVMYALTSGCSWRHPPPTFGTSLAAAHRRFTVWAEACPQKEIPALPKAGKASADELEMAHQLIDALTINRQPEDYRDGPRV